MKDEEEKKNMMESTRTAHQKSLEELVSHVHLEWEVLQTNPVLAPHEPVLHPEHLNVLTIPPMLFPPYHPTSN